MQINRLKRIDWEWVQVLEDMTPEELLEYQQSLIPQTITPRQIRLALIQSGISLSTIDTMIDSTDEPQKSVLKILREYSSSYERDDAMLIQFAQQLGMTDEQLDQLFILWGTL